jgi:phosphate transport system permease protein
VGETAPLLFTAFGSQIMNTNVFSHPQESLPLVVWSNVHQAQPVLIDLAYQSAFVLLVLVLILFVAARIVGRTRGKKSRRVRTNTQPPAGPDAPTPSDAAWSLLGPVN